MIAIQPFKVLVAGPMMSNRKLLELYVENTFGRGVPRYTHCSTVKEALAAIAEQRYDLALIEASQVSRGFDIRGAEVVLELRKTPLNKDIAVIAISGNPAHEEIMMKVGADGFIDRNSSESAPIDQFGDKAFDALVKAADRDPKPYIALFRRIGIITQDDLQSPH